MLTFTSIETNELNCVTFIPQAKKAKLLNKLYFAMIHAKVIIKGASKGVIVMITWYTIIPKIWDLFLNLVDL